MAKINVQNTAISVVQYNDEDYISLTDMANAKESESRAADIIKNWLRNRYTIEFLGTWEMIHNPAFKVVEFDHFRMQAGLPNFVLSVSEWIERTGAIGIIVKKGRYGGTYAFREPFVSETCGNCIMFFAILHTDVINLLRVHTRVYSCRHGIKYTSIYYSSLTYALYLLRGFY